MSEERVLGAYTLQSELGSARLDTRGRMEARFALWKATRDTSYLAEAKRMLDYARDHAPEECRESMIQNVPLHRDIMAASEAQQA